MARAIKAIQPGQKVIERLEGLVEVCDDLVEQIDTVSLAVDDIKQTLGELAREKPELKELLLPVPTKRRRELGAVTTAVTYAHSVDLKWGLNSVEVRIDGQTVVLTPKPGLLLQVLLEEDAAPLPLAAAGWRTREELALLLAKLAGKPVTKHALENLISRLKKELHQQAGLGFLVQSDRRFGVRLALDKYAPLSPGI